jgi:ClpP class serine protease
MVALADAAFALRQIKSLVAYCEDACSAGYFLASQAERVYVAPDGYTGCIGTLVLLTDWSRMYIAEGIVRYRITSTGAETHKGQGAMGTEVTPEQQADFKRVNDEHQGLFNAAVIRGRGVTPETMATLADGRYHVGQWGVDLGLADSVATEAQVLDALNAGQVDLPAPQPDGPPEDDEPEQTRAPANTSIPTTTATTTPTTTSPQGGAATMDIGKYFRRVADEVDKEMGQQTGIAQSNTAGVQNSPPSNAPSGGSSVPPGTTTDADTAEMTRLRAVEARVLGQTRTAATQAAVRAFGDKPERLEKAKTAIANCTDLDDLQGMLARYEEQIPDSLRPQSTPAERQVSGNEQLRTTGNEAELYATIRANPAK